MLSNSSSPIVTGVVTPSPLMTSGTVFEWPTTRTLPLAPSSCLTSVSGVLRRDDLDRQAERLGERRGRLLRALELGGVDRGDLRVLQRRRQRLGARAPASDKSGSAAIVGLAPGVVSARSAWRTRKTVCCAAAGVAARRRGEVRETVRFSMLSSLYTNMNRRSRDQEISSDRIQLLHRRQPPPDGDQVQHSPRRRAR